MIDDRVVITRPDGRPEAYDMIPEDGSEVACEVCKGTIRDFMRYKAHEAVLCSPIDAADGQSHFVCIHHLPDNVVIYDPKTGLCRSKDGQSVWREGTNG